MSVAACAELVRQGDPDRFLAAMAAPPTARDLLLPLYAFNLEIARAPWVSAEPAIGAMRLQFWRDALDEIAAGQPARAHEVATPLADVLRGAAVPAALLDTMVVARWRDLEPEAMTEAELTDYLDATAGGLMWASALALGAEAGLETPMRALGRAMGLANWLLAAADLAARGRAGWPLAGGDGLIDAALQDLALARRAKFGPAIPAARAAWRARGVLVRAKAQSDAITSGGIGGSEFARRGGLLLRSLTGRA